jgi:phosphatidyl-myo-inositol alpha-mannosyltransferase
MSARPLSIAMSSYYLPSESKIGAGYVAHRLAGAMTERGHDVTMFSPCSKPDDAKYQHVQVAVSPPLRTQRWALALRHLDLDGFDVFHAHGDNHFRVSKRTPAYVRTLMGSCFSEAIHIHGAKERLRMFMLGCTEVAGSLVADKTVAISQNTRHWFPWVSSVIPPGVDLGLFRPGEKTPDPTILFVGTYEQRKRGRMLVEAFTEHVLPRVPGAKLWMVCSDAPSSTGVEVLGRLTDEELASRYRAAWVFCLPSSYEGFGVPYVEAMASGTAVVATPNVGAKEVLAGGEFGVLTEPTALGVALADVLLDDSHRDKLAAAGLGRASEYDWNAVCAQYEHLYFRILS